MNTIMAFRLFDHTGCLNSHEILWHELTRLDLPPPFQRFNVHMLFLFSNACNFDELCFLYSLKIKRRVLAGYAGGSRCI